MEKASREDQEKLDRNVQMTVGLSALKKVADIAHEIKRDDENNRRLVKRIITLSVILIALAVAIFIVFPHMGFSVLRTITANLH
jgi:type IV secretory pathway component VirB8